jgi:hypothetical protein
MICSFIDTTGRFITIMLGVLTGVAFYTQNIWLGYLLGIMCYIACAIDTSKEEKKTK